MLTPPSTALTRLRAPDVVALIRAHQRSAKTQRAAGKVKDAWQHEEWVMLLQIDLIVRYGYTAQEAEMLDQEVEVSR